MPVNNKKIRLFDVVALTHDLPEHNLWRGQVGTVVEILSNDDAYEVEFSDRDGRTYQSLGFRAPQLMAVHDTPTYKQEFECDTRKFSRTHSNSI